MFICLYAFFKKNNITLIFHLLNPHFKRTWNNGITVSFGKNNRQFMFKFRLKHTAFILLILRDLERADTCSKLRERQHLMN